MSDRSHDDAGGDWTRVCETAFKRGPWTIAKLRSGGRVIFRAWKDGEQYPAFHNEVLAEVVGYVDRREGRA